MLLQENRFNRYQRSPDRWDVLGEFRWSMADGLTKNRLGGWTMQSNRWIGMAALTASLAGCQCFALTEHYQDHIDHIAGRRPNFDHWYNPGWDVSRIGQPDWYECAWNRHWVDPVHIRGLRPLPGYTHNPIPTPSDLSAHSPIAPLPVPAADPTAPEQTIDQLQPIRDPSQLDDGSLAPPLPPRVPNPPLPAAP